VARVRQARRCSARRTNGEPCRAYAIVGGTVCRVHGGSAPQVRHAAYVAAFEARARRQFESDLRRLAKRRQDWMIRRIVITSLLLDIPPEKVDRWDIILCHVEHGVPELEDSAPTFATLPRDRRFRHLEPPTTSRSV